MKRNLIIAFLSLAFAAAFILFILPRPFAQHERRILYWTDAMIPGDRSDHPGKSPMGMERTPVYADDGFTGSSGDTESETSYYTCPMHPSVHKTKPGACPVCGMALVKKSSIQAAPDSDIARVNGVSLSAAQRVTANVRTSTVKRATLKKSVTAVGVVDFAEPNYVHISMRFPGRVDRLYLSYTGQSVRKGDPVAEVYSPEAISAQQEYVLALESHEQLKNAPEDVVQGALDLQEQARQKLLRWGFTQRQVMILEKTRAYARSVTIFSPISGTVMKKKVDPQQYVAMGEEIFDVADLSTVWVYLDVYEKDIRFVTTGQTVRITTEAYPGETFAGRITFVDAVLNAETRAVRVRTEFRNSSGKLKPNMYVKASIAVPTVNASVIPTSAVLSTGKRSVVWVEVRPNTFEPRDVLVGATTDSLAEVLSGLSVGEKVAESGGFLIDSESSLLRPASRSEQPETQPQQAVPLKSEPPAKNNEGRRHD